MKKKNKGFTLIELLAVIVILGIILTIVVSNVVKYIGKAREGAFKDTYAKVLKDVSNKIALNDLGGDTEEVECKNPTECAAAYDVPAENITLLVTKLNDDKYSVSMKGIGSYSSIALTSTSKPNNAGLIDEQTISSTIDSDGEVKANEIGNSKFFNNLTKNDSNLTVVDAAPLKIVSYITYEDNNGSSQTKFYGMDGNEVSIIIKEEKIEEFKKVLKEFNAFISTCSLNKCKNYEDIDASKSNINRYTVEIAGSTKYQTLRPKIEYLGENSGTSKCGKNCTWLNNNGWRIQYQEQIS